MMKPQNDKFRKQVMSCWLGKSIGGTLGLPYEGKDGPFDLTFYNPVPTGMIPNDDLDLQVVWACTLDKLETPRVDRYILAKAWQDHVGFCFDEYAVALRNLKLGLKPPLTGIYDNYFINGMGAAIRSELWACLAPGNPILAARYAYEDACVDHDKEGIWAIIFLAALESQAFVESDCDILLDTALSQLPPVSLIRQAVSDTRTWLYQGNDWRVVREKILHSYGNEFAMDVTMNIAFTILGWLASNGNFSDGICIAANCGKDTDCTAATVGALLGILNPDCIDARWLTPIGNTLILSPEIVGLTPPDTLEGFTDLVLSLKDRLAGKIPVCESASQTTEKFAVEADAAFISRDELESMKQSGTQEFPQNFSRMQFPGVLADMNASDFKNDVMLLRYRLILDEDMSVRIIFNSHQENYAWIDGKYGFGRVSGPMLPSPHRSHGLKNQYADVNLSAGEHEIICAICRPADSCNVKWILIAADQKTKQWIPRAFHNNAK